jgi:tRNA threonylcarbamoyladenosine biosynthesis protein TsaE
MKRRISLLTGEILYGGLDVIRTAGLRSTSGRTTRYHARMRPGETLLLTSDDAQRAFGASLLPSLAPGAVLFLEGELGAGKTTLTQGLIAALGFTGLVVSPTYALMQLYPTPQGMALHVDAYRIRHPQELYEMDLDRLISETRVSVIEWGQPFYDDFPEAWLLRLEHVDGGRRVTRVR